MSKGNTVRKISFLSVIIMIIGSSVGAGIFMKNSEILRNAHQNIELAILAWVIAGLGCLTMGVALIELTSATYKNNRGILGWTKTFTNRFANNGAKNYMAYIFVPFDRFIMPIYFVMKLQDAFHWNIDWWVIFLIGIAIFLWFTILSGLYTTVGNVQNWIITIIKIIPIVVIIIWGYAKVDPTVIHTTIDTNNDMWRSSPSSAFSPVFGLIASIPAIYFAIDGFYTAVSVTSEMKNPKQAPVAVILGIGIIIVLYLVISCAMLVSSSNGGVTGIESLNNIFGGKLMTVLNVLIGIGILGIENGYCMMAPRMYEEMIRANELPLSHRYINKLNPHRPVVGVLISIAICTPYFIIFTLIGAFGFYDMGNYATGEAASYLTHHDATLYSFCDLLGNWSSFFIFVLITVAIAGGISNRKTGKVAVKKNRNFLWCAWITLILNTIALAYIFITCFVDFGIFVAHQDFYGNNWIGGLLRIVILLIIIGASLLPDVFRDLYRRKKGLCRAEQASFIPHDKTTPSPLNTPIEK